MSESVEEYLEAIYAFNESGELAKNQNLAEKLRVSPASVTQMIKKLADERLITYEPYKGVLLTGKGSARAQSVVRKHRLLERFLHDSLGFSKEKVHDEACRLEHSVSDEVASALCEKLNNPSTCPDDSKAIPPCTLNYSSCDECKTLRENAKPRLLTQLSMMRPGDSGRVAFTRGGGTACQRIGDMGLCSGAEIKVVNAAPFQGPIEVEVKGTRLALGRGLAEKVYVEVAETKEPVAHPHGPHHIIH
ncbi:TPA: metal-dependent transcriptional regulator [Candidatus Bathyarchaeota archaeon]|nr:metal-dependent transcriptional regulator [Candidatus Bathyarchaeota archaeon]